MSTPRRRQAHAAFVSAKLAYERAYAELATAMAVPPTAREREDNAKVDVWMTGAGRPIAPGLYRARDLAVTAYRTR